MSFTRRSVLAAGAALGVAPLSRAGAQANTIKIGVLNDMSGPYRDISGPYGVACTKQAVAEFGMQGFNVEVINADHQNKPDVGAGLARHAQRGQGAGGQQRAQFLALGHQFG